MVKKREAIQRAEYNNSHSMMGQAFPALHDRKTQFTTRPFTPSNARKFADPAKILGLWIGLSVAGAIATIAILETGGAILPILQSTTVGVSSTTGMLAETSIFSTGSIVNIGSGGLGTYLGTSLIKSSFDITAQAVVFGPKNVDVYDGFASGFITPGWAAVTGAFVDYKPGSYKQNFRVVGFNKGMGEFITDATLKYAFGSNGVGQYPKQVSDQIVKLGAPQLAPVFNAPYTLTGKITSYKAKQFFK